MKRTPKEIRRWFRSRLWYHDFLRNAWFGRSSVKSAISIISGHCGMDTLMHAFRWDNTLQGSLFWEDRNCEFIKWYKYGWK